MSVSHALWLIVLCLVVCTSDGHHIFN